MMTERPWSCRAEAVISAADAEPMINQDGHWHIHGQVIHIRPKILKAIRMAPLGCEDNTDRAKKASATYTACLRRPP